MINQTKFEPKIRNENSVQTSYDRVLKYFVSSELNFHPKDFVPPKKSSLANQLCLWGCPREAEAGAAARPPAADPKLKAAEGAEAEG